MQIPNLEQYVAIFPNATGTGPVPKRSEKNPCLGITFRISPLEILIGDSYDFYIKLNVVGIH